MRMVYCLPTDVDEDDREHACLMECDDFRENLLDRDCVRENPLDRDCVHESLL